ncbi:KRRI-Interacting protein 1 [Onygenales sp. PD_10]|nr:KRRI-Interacting protein 1 [Onygenales sp. PD_10]
MEPPAKKQRKVLLDDDSSDESGEDGGALLNANGAEAGGFKINEEYAKRFEYNKKREEMQHLEEKLGKSANGKRKQNVDDASEDSSSESEDEDDDGELATGELDREISETLNAIRNKDPRVYDVNVKFYSEIKETEDGEPEQSKKEKPMFLRDYHRENLLRGAGVEDTEDAPKTFAQEQEDLKREIIKEMHAPDDEASDNDDDDDDGGFLIPKTKPASSKPAQEPVELDVEAADKDPEKFLSNFLAARAWIPAERPNFQPFESDDEEEDRKAEAFEEAYNFRFEDPNKINEVLVTHSRDTTSKFSVRREEPNSRKKKRDAEKSKKEEEKKQREVERNRLRKLKIEQIEEKVQKIKTAAGLRTADITEEDWAHFLDDGWDDEKWEQEMEKRFGEQYYEQAEEGSDLDDGEAGKSSKRRLKKPKWDDDIDIKDLVPDFDDEEQAQVSDVEMQDAQDEDEDETGEPKVSKKKKALQDKKEKQKEARKERRKIEQLVDNSLDLDPTLLPGASKKFTGSFRYRESSPVSYGLTPRDILMADDAQLNQFAGLKKLASFRDPEKKKRDLKKMGKKARLRQWRKDTFGDENGPPEPVIPEPSSVDASGAVDNDGAMKVDIREGKKKRKRSKKH